ncbi:MAG: glycosyltransferase family 1 protein [Gammaproteobacteria bacterium]|nr:glycosyltransferase family 1 protein [Gammaproteobacteria bacterium]NIR98147.1 glycosyltransferase family 1 protein [Gammaproteobacteria bacterium]NIT62534.1 glycosyltransferase family 1 protein [Gammaproteobacteria bacterium]NIV20791.1 glycosyltransferase [Gammaproteobacteria bacterium]NIY31114.1 glycosyltransferase [Gammaproteobacteria bacterium]
MHIAFLNAHGNFDPQDRYWTAHPDFGGQLVYVKEASLALGRMGHRVDIVTRQIVDPQWPGFDSRFDGYPGELNVRIVRLPFGGQGFRRKQDLWPYIGPEWVPAIEAFYADEGQLPNAATSHYADAGLAAALWRARGGPPFTFTAHSLGAQKLERLLVHNHTTLGELDAEFFFARRIAAERAAASHADRIITSTHQERTVQYGHAAYRDAVDPADDRRFAVVSPGVNLHIFDAGVHGPDDERIARRVEQILERDITSERRGLPAVICSSRLEPKKNHIGLVLAFARSAELRAAANLLLVVRGTEDLRSGMGLARHERPVMEEIVASCEAYGLWGSVAAISLEGQSELAAAYRHLAQRRSAFALTALYEPFGLAPLEAAAAGLPVAVTCNGGPGETLREADTGEEYAVLVDPSDPADIAAGLLRLVGSEDRWRHFQAAGRRRVLDRFTWEHTAQGYLSVLEAIATAAPRSGLAMPRYFTEPAPEHDLGLGELRRIFEGG